MKIGIHGKNFGAGTAGLIQQVLDELALRNVDITISDSFMTLLKNNQIKLHDPAVYSGKDDLTGLDFMLTLGGDGTLLSAVTHIGKTGVPILGINTGRLGFLATTAKDGFKEAIQALFDGEYTYDERTLLRLESNTNLFDGLNFALNDFTILKKDTSSMVTIRAYIDGEFLNTYWADGVIVATPTGSTGYSISCGGPLVLPQSNNFIITPVSPHNLTVRPMVVPDDCELSFSIEGRGKQFLISLDSRTEVIDDTVQLVVRKEDFKTKLVKLKDNNYFNTLRQKLNWGLDVRN